MIRIHENLTTETKKQLEDLSDTMSQGNNDDLMEKLTPEIIELFEKLYDEIGEFLRLRIKMSS